MGRQSRSHWRSCSNKSRRINNTYFQNVIRQGRPKAYKAAGRLFFVVCISVSYMLSNTSIQSNIHVGTLGRSVRKMFIVCKVLFRTFEDIQKNTISRKPARHCFCPSRMRRSYDRDSLSFMFAIHSLSYSRL